MMKDICHFVKPTINMMLTLDLIEEEHNDCFYVETTVEPGCFMLLIAAVLLNISHQFITRAAGAAIEDREMLRRGLPLVPHYTYFQCLMLPCFCCVTRTSVGEAGAGGASGRGGPRLNVHGPNGDGGARCRVKPDGIE